MFLFFVFVFLFLIYLDVTVISGTVFGCYLSNISADIDKKIYFK